MKNIYKILLASLFINVVFLVYGFRLINGLGGIEYVKLRYSNKIQKSDSNTAVYKNKSSIFHILPHHSNEILFIGDSNIAYAEWNDLFDNKNIHNRGIAGDDINGVSLRIDECLSSHPNKIFLMIGINNLINNNDSEQKVLTEYEDLIKKIKTKSPYTKLYIQSILPTYGHIKSFNSSIVLINKGLISLSEKYSYNYIDLFSSFRDSDDQLIANYSFDGIHLNGSGYLVWKCKIQQFVN